MFEPQDEYQDVFDQLRLLEPTEPVSAESALMRFKKQHPIPVQRRFLTMTTRRFAFASVALIAIIAIFSALPSTRAFASQVLGLFRVQKFAAISVSPQQLELIGQLADEGLFPGEIDVVDDDVEPQSFDTFEVAAQYQATGDDYPMFSSAVTISEWGTPTDIHIEGGGTANLKVNVTNARKILESVNMDPQRLPDSLDGQTVTFDLNPTLIQEWENGTFIQTQSPYINYPTDVDPSVIGEAMLRFMGMNEGEAARLARNIDWTNTLILPIPSEVGTFSEIPIGENGSGLAIESLDGSGIVLMWEEWGMINMLTAEDLNRDQLVQVANDIR